MVVPTCVLHVDNRRDLAAPSYPHSSCCHTCLRPPAPRPAPVRWVLARTRCVPWPFNVCRKLCRGHTPARRTCAAAVTTRVFWGTARHGTGRAVKGVRLARAVDEVIKALTIVSVCVCVLDKVLEKTGNVECSTALCVLHLDPPDPTF